MKSFVKLKKIDTESIDTLKLQWKKIVDKMKTDGAARWRSG